MVVAKTDAAGERGLMPEVLAFSSSLALDQQLVREDLVGSLAHLTMLARTGIIPKGAAARIRGGLVGIWSAQGAGTLVLPKEEDVHMAVEATLAASLGEIAGLLHSARSRNDQVALDLRLHVREACVGALEALATLVDGLATRAAAEGDTLLPSYTHRQRAQPISLSYLFCGWASMFSRDAETLSFVLEQTDALPLGVGAIAGTSLPIDRELTRELLQFSRLTPNGLDTVGDRDFALDFTFAAAKSLLHIGRVSTDLVDFSTREFGFVKLDGAIACGSSMMPQKKNPDVFELLRGKNGRAIGNLMSLLVTLKGLPSGYNRDLQEDRQPLLETGPLLVGALSMLQFALDRVRFDPERTFAALSGDYTQATDVAEALVLKGVPFRTAYGLVGKLVRACQDAGLPLARATLAMGQAIDARLDTEVLRCCDPRASVERKRNQGGTGPASVRAQIDELHTRASAIRAKARSVPLLSTLFAALQDAPLEAGSR